MMLGFAGMLPVFGNQMTTELSGYVVFFLSISGNVCASHLML